MARPSNWNSPTKSIRVPEHAVDAVMALARQLDGIDEPESNVQNPDLITYKPASDAETIKQGLIEGWIVPTKGSCLKSDLVALIRRHEDKLDGLGEWIDRTTSTRYQKRTLAEDNLNLAYRSIAFALAGHETNEGCKGIFARIQPGEVEPLLLLLLMELAASVDRPHGGSIHQVGADDAA